MKKSNHAILFFSFMAVLIFCAPIKVYSQSAFGFSEIEYLTRNTGFGARALSMGGAYLTEGNDFSGVYWNPAGLAMIKRQEIFASLNNLNTNVNTNIFSVNSKSSRTTTKLDAFGYTYPVPVYRGSLVLSLGYYRTENYNTSINFQGFNNGPSASSYLFTEPAVGNSVTHQENLAETGHMAVYTVAGAVEATKNMYVGISLNMYKGENDYTLDFIETDTDYLYQVFPDDFESYNQLNEIYADIKGYDLKIGFMYKANKNIRLAAAMTTPRKYKIEEEFRFYDNVTFDNGETDPLSDEGLTSYKVQLPFKFEAGMSFSIPNLLITGGIEYQDWSQLKYRTEPPVEDMTMFEANESIRNNIEASLTKRVGIEYLVAPLNAALRAGFYMVPSPYKNAGPENDKKYVTFGVGALISPQLKVDVSYIHGTWESETPDNFIDEIIYEKRTDKRLFATISTRF